MPERELASYAEELPVDARAAVSQPTGKPDAGLAPMRGVTPLSGAAPDAGDAGADGGPARALSCRPECQCELRERQTFMFCDGPVARAVAAARCLEAGGALVSIEDSALNGWLSQRMGAVATDDYWTFGTDAETEGVWRWGDEGPVFYDSTRDAGGSGFAPWDDNQPNDLDGEDCLRSIGGLWRDLECTDEIAYACES